VRRALEDAGPAYFMDAEQLAQPPSRTWVDAGCRRLGLVLDEPLLREITPPIFASERDALTCGEGTLDAVRDLHARGYVLGCVTNTLADTATIRAMLRDDGFEELMMSVVVSADEGWRKPHPSLFEKALRETGVAPDDAVFVGDSPLHDIGGAKAVGMHAVLTQQYVARLKDDEFAVLLPETNRAAAVSVTTRLLASLSQVSVFGDDGSPEPMKASVAIVCFPEDGTSAKDLLDNAMADLAQAKREREEQAKLHAARTVNPLARSSNERLRG
jgi:HAD superfamily hydrolase (TIGR01662 family)